MYTQVLSSHLRLVAATILWHKKQQGWHCTLTSSKQWRIDFLIIFILISKCICILLKKFLGLKYTTIKASCMSEKGLFQSCSISYITQRSITGLLYTLYKGHFYFPPQLFRCFHASQKNYHRLQKRFRLRFSKHRCLIWEIPMGYIWNNALFFQLLCSI